MHLFIDTNSEIPDGGDSQKSINLPRKVTTCLITLLALQFFSVPSFGQCDTDGFMDYCASNLGTYNYIKSFKANASRKRRSGKEFTYVLSKGSGYSLIACGEKLDGGRMIISLFDRNHEQIASTRNEEQAKDYTELIYECNTTGVYYIKISFEGSGKGCGMCILGMSTDDRK